MNLNRSYPHSNCPHQSSNQNFGVHLLLDIYFGPIIKIEISALMILWLGFSQYSAWNFASYRKKIKINTQRKSMFEETFDKKKKVT